MGVVLLVISITPAWQYCRRNSLLLINRCSLIYMKCCSTTMPCTVLNNFVRNSCFKHTRCPSRTKTVICLVPQYSSLFTHILHPVYFFQQRPDHTKLNHHLTHSTLPSNRTHLFLLPYVAICWNTALAGKHNIVLSVKGQHNAWQLYSGFIFIRTGTVFWTILSIHHITANFTIIIGIPHHQTQIVTA